MKTYYFSKPRYFPMFEDVVNNRIVLLRVCEKNTYYDTRISKIETLQKIGSGYQHLLSYLSNQ